MHMLHCSRISSYTAHNREHLRAMHPHVPCSPQTQDNNDGLNFSLPVLQPGKGAQWAPPRTISSVEVGGCVWVVVRCCEVPQ